MKKLIPIAVVAAAVIWVSCNKESQLTQYDLQTINSTQNFAVLNGDAELLSKAKNSYHQTFGSATDKIAITKVEVLKDSKVEIHTVFYKGSNGIESTFLVVFALTDGITANGIELKAMENTTIDCNGGCDCRERFYPGTGAIECTCSDCKMTIEQTI